MQLVRCLCRHAYGSQCERESVWHFTYDTTHPSSVFDFGKQLICLVC